VRALIVLALMLLPAVAAAQGDEPPTGPRLVLLGVVLREDGHSFAIIEDAHTARVGFYRVGASVGGVRVRSIEADRVVVAADDAPTVLRLGTPVGIAPKPSPSVPVPVARGAGDRPALSPEAAPPPTRLPRLYGLPVEVSRPAPPARREPPVSTGTGGPGGGGSTVTSPTGVAADVTFTGLRHDGASRRSTQFSSAALRDLLIEVTYRGLSGSRQQRIELYAPDGSLYQKMTGPAAPATQTRLPVGGTWITTHGLLGSWTVKVFVDGQAAPAGGATFVLTP
jgi:hypothetical protein